LLIQLSTYYVNSSAVLYVRKYSNGNTALIAILESGEPLLKLSSNIQELILPKEKMLLKSYSKNEGVFSCLVAEGVIEPIVQYSKVTTLPIATLTKKAQELLFECEIRNQNWKSSF
jgi:hypothetical protein